MKTIDATFRVYGTCIYTDWFGGVGIGVNVRLVEMKMGASGKEWQAFAPMNVSNCERTDI